MTQRYALWLTSRRTASLRREPGGTVQILTSLEIRRIERHRLPESVGRFGVTSQLRECRTPIEVRISMTRPRLVRRPVLLDGRLHLASPEQRVPIVDAGV